MHDINPLGAILHLKELDRQATPQLQPLRPERRSTRIVAINAVVRRFYAVAFRQESKVREKMAGWFATRRRQTNW